MTGGSGTGTPVSVSATSQIAELRRRVNEPTATTYSDATLQVYIEKFPLPDALGYRPFYSDGITADPNWTATYDLNAAAERIWAEKANQFVGKYDFSADGASYTRSQAYEMAMKQARYYASRKAPKSLRIKVARDFERDFQADPQSVIEDGGGGDTTYIINLAEPDDS
jgi:hypothetical protein